MKNILGNYLQRKTLIFIKRYAELFYSVEGCNFSFFYEYLVELERIQALFITAGLLFFEYFYPLYFFKLSRFSQLSYQSRIRLVVAAENSKILALRQLSLKFKMVSSLIYFLNDGNKEKINYSVKYLYE